MLKPAFLYWNSEKKHTTNFTKEIREKGPLPKRPDEVFELLKYPTKIGKMAAYLNKPGDLTEKHPAIIWITEGCSLMAGGSSLWESTSIVNEQSARILPFSFASGSLSA